MSFVHVQSFSVFVEQKKSETQSVAETQSHGDYEQSNILFTTPQIKIPTTRVSFICVRFTIMILGEVDAWHLPT